MRQTTVTASSAGVTPPVVLDQYLTPFNATYVKTGSGTVQVTATDPFSGDALVWSTAPTTAPNAANFLGQPYRAIRLSGAAENDTLTVIQAGIQ